MVDNIRMFIVNGLRVFHNATRRNYGVQTEEMKKMRDEVMDKTTTRETDAINLRNDRRNIERDIRVSFNKLVLSNG